MVRGTVHDSDNGSNTGRTKALGDPAAHRTHETGASFNMREPARATEGGHQDGFLPLPQRAFSLGRAQDAGGELSVDLGAVVGG